MSGKAKTADIRGARVVIVGAGVAGLAAAWHLSGLGAQVTLLEREEAAGGMASAFDAGGRRLDRYYHYFSGGDKEVEGLAATLMPDEPIVWRAAPVGILYKGACHDFSTPADLLTFSPLTAVDRGRMTAHMLHCLTIQDPDFLRSIPATTWLRRWLGERGYRAIWEPLLLHKFGRHVDKVSSAWLWARIRRMANNPRGALWRRTYGFLPGGSHRLIERLAEGVMERNVALLRRTEVTRLETDGRNVTSVHYGENGRAACDAVVSTLPLPQLASMLDHRRTGSTDTWPPATDYLPVTVLVLLLSRPLTPYFWLNTNDPGFQFPGVIGYSNLDPRVVETGLHLAYIPFYGDPGTETHRLGADELLRMLDKDIRRIDPGFNAGQVAGAWVFRDRFGQSVCHVDEEPPKSPGRSPLDNLFVTDSSLLHPEDRTINGALSQGRRAAQQVTRCLRGEAV